MPVDPQRVERMLNPRTIVVVGDKGPNFQWTGSQHEFTGDLWSVQLDPKEIEGLEERGITNFLSLDEVPGDIDLVICAVPRPITPLIVGAAIKRGVGGMSMFTSGFAETDEPEGIALQERIGQMALDAGMPIVGPNCLGIYNRRLGVKFVQAQEQGEGGNVSVISQSGTYAGGLTMGLQNAGVKVSRTVSIGNAVVMNECDYLEYLLDDEHTEVIAMYLEGTKDARRFFDLMRRARGRKPVVIWRGGLTRAGERAVHSHTGSLAASSEVWGGVLRQTGAIAVSSADEVVDTVAALVQTTPTSKRNLALIAMTGGHSVAICDQFERAGFEVPELSQRSYDRLGEFFTVIGGSYRNPFDATWTLGTTDEASDNLKRLFEILVDEPATNGGMAIELRTFGYDENPRRLETTLDLLDEYRERTGQPVIGLMLAGGPGGGDAAEAAEKARKAVAEHGIAYYPSFQRGAEALGRVVDYYAALEDK